MNRIPVHVIVLLVSISCDRNPGQRGSSLVGDPGSDSVARFLLQEFKEASRPQGADFDLGHSWTCSMRETWGQSEETGYATAKFDNHRDFPRLINGSLEITEPLSSAPAGKYLFEGYNPEGRSEFTNEVLSISRQRLGVSEETVISTFDATPDRMNEFVEYLHEYHPRAWLNHFRFAIERQETMRQSDVELPDRPLSMDFCVRKSGSDTLMIQASARRWLTTLNFSGFTVESGLVPGQLNSVQSYPMKLAAIPVWQRNRSELAQEMAGIASGASQSTVRDSECFEEDRNQRVLWVASCTPEYADQ